MPDIDKNLAYAVQKQYIIKEPKKIGVVGCERLKLSEAPGQNAIK